MTPAFSPCPGVGKVSYSLCLLADTECISSAWAATTRDNNFVRMEGFKRLVNEPKHRKELVAGGLVQHLVAGVFLNE